MMAPYLAGESTTAIDQLYFARRMPDAENEGGVRIPAQSPRTANEPAGTTLPIAGTARRKRLQYYLRKIKRLVKEDGRSRSSPVGGAEGGQSPKLSTFEALERTIELIRASQKSAADPVSGLLNEDSSSSAASEEPRIEATAIESNSGGGSNKPASPANSSWSAAATSDSSCSASPNNDTKCPPGKDSNELARNGSMAGSHHITAAAATTASALGRRFIGCLVLSLPEGVIIECRPFADKAEERLDRILQPGDSLLPLLHGKGAQTLLLNAFCGHAKRRMYARLKWGNGGLIRACEFICEFTKDSNNVSMRVATIQAFCVESAFQQPQSISSMLPRIVFTTRHNASCAVIYLDSASIPILGHFPSETTGKSLFALVHPQDVPIVKEAHQKLRLTCGGKIVLTPSLRLLTYGGGFAIVDSEWSAYVNPWTHQIEMIVGRHQMIAAGEAGGSSGVYQLTSEELRENDAFIHNILSQPVAEKTRRETVNVQINESTIDAQQVGQANGSNNNLGSYIDKLVENLVMNGPVAGNEDLSPSVSPLKQEEMTERSADDSPNQSPDIVLSYNQINCLENVHRLLKSQTTKKEEQTPSLPQMHNTINEQSINTAVGGALTEELLQQHNKTWEDSCKETWKKRLTLKRISQRPPDHVPQAKMARGFYSNNNSLAAIQNRESGGGSRTGSLTSCETTAFHSTSVERNRRAISSSSPPFALDPRHQQQQYAGIVPNSWTRYFSNMHSPLASALLQGLANTNNAVDKQLQIELLCRNVLQLQSHLVGRPSAN